MSDASVHEPIHAASGRLYGHCADCGALLPLEPRGRLPRHADDGRTGIMMAPLEPACPGSHDKSHGWPH